MRFLVVFLASGAYTGYAPVASGTFGTVVAVPLWFALERWLGFSPPLYVLAVALLVVVASTVAGKADQVFGEHDSHRVVIDEIVGYLAATLFLPVTWSYAVAAFLVFRVLDIVKPFPAGYVDEHVPGGYGVVLDDVVSGVYTNLVLRLGALVLGAA